MQHQNKPRPHARDPFAYENPWEMKPIRPMRRPRPTPRPQNNHGMDDAANGIISVAKLGIIAGTTMGITSGIIGAMNK